MDREQHNAVYAPPAAFDPEGPASAELAASTRAAGWMLLVQSALFLAFGLAVPSPTHASAVILLVLLIVAGVALLRVRHALVRPLAVVLLVAPITYQMLSGADSPKHAAALLVLKAIGLAMFLSPVLLLLVGRPSSARRKVGIALFVLVQLLLVISITVEAIVERGHPLSAPAGSPSGGTRR